MDVKQKKNFLKIFGEYAKLYISFLRNFKNKIEEKNGRETNNEKGKVKMKYEVKMEARRKLWENDE